MKYLFYILLIVIFSGCQKMMHEEDYSISQINSPEKMDIAVNGLYSRLAQYINSRLVQDFDNAWMIPGFLADDFPPSPIYKYRYIDYGDDYAKINWQGLYNIIASANNIICQFQNNININSNFRADLGEAYLLRAYAYFRLVRIFGQVPIVDNIEINYSLTKSSFKDIYAFIESDLIKAASLLPVNKSNARIPNQSPVSGSAKAMLAEVYLTMGGYPLLDNSKYILAAQAAKSVMDSANIYGFALMPDYANLWDGTDILNREIVFGLFFSKYGKKRVFYQYTDEGVIHSFFVWTYNFETTNYLSYYASQMSNYCYSSFFIPEKIFFNSFPISYRKDVTFQTTFLTETSTFKYTDSDSLHYIQTDKYTPSKSLSWRSEIFYKKYGYYFQYDSLSVITTYGRRMYITWDNEYRLVSDSTQGDIGKTYYINYSQSIYIYRYAHVLLTYAEAKARSGQLDASAYEAVNMVRRRANKVDIHSPSKYDLPPGLSAQQFADSVVNERAWEFCAEPEGRWFDLLRLEMIEQLPKLKSYSSYPSYPPPPDFTKSDYFEAIPKSEKVLDPNLN